MKIKQYASTERTKVGSSLWWEKTGAEIAEKNRWGAVYGPWRTYAAITVGVYSGLAFTFQFSQHLHFNCNEKYGVNCYKLRKNRCYSSTKKTGCYSSTEKTGCYSSTEKPGPTAAQKKPGATAAQKKRGATVAQKKTRATQEMGSEEYMLQ